MRSPMDHVPRLHPVAESSKHVRLAARSYVRRPMAGNRRDRAKIAESAEKYRSSRPERSDRDRGCVDGYHRGVTYPASVCSALPVRVEAHVRNVRSFAA